MTTTAQLRDMVVDILMGATAAGAQVYSPRTWPTQNHQYPCLMVQAPEESKDSLGRNVPQFNVVGTVRVIARVEMKAEPNDAAAAKVEAALEVFKAKIEMAVINNPDLTRLIQQFLSVRSSMSVDSTGGTYLGGLTIDFQLEFYQGPEDFYPQDFPDLDQIDIRPDLINVVDQTGTYPDPPFPQSVTPAPRTVGPDGRNEGRVVVDLNS